MIKLYSEYMIRKTRYSSIEIKTGVEASASSIRAEDPDVLIVAIGVYIIGDCSKPGMLMNAIHDGFNIAVEI